MIRKTGFCILIVCILCVLMIGCGDGSQLENDVQDTSLQDIKEKGHFVLGINKGLPPLSYIDRNGENTGFDLELMTEVAKRMGVEIQIKSENYESGLEYLKNGEVDILNGLSIGESEEIDYSIPYIDSGSLILVRSDSQLMTDNLENKKIGVVLNSKGHDILTSDDTFLNSVSELLTYDTNQEVLTQLGVGIVDAAVVEEAFGRYIMRQRPSEFRIIDEIEGIVYGMGFRNDEDTFREEVDRILDEMKEDGTMSNISRKWFGNDLILE